MPSGPPELHEFWCNHGPTEYGDLNAMKYLKDRGYKLTKKWSWVLPSKGYEPRALDNSAINYLCWEWDFGGIDTPSGLL